MQPMELKAETIANVAAIGALWYKYVMWYCDMRLNIKSPCDNFGQ